MGYLLFDHERREQDRKFKQNRTKLDPGTLVSVIESGPEKGL